MRQRRPGDLAPDRPWQRGIGRDTVNYCPGCRWWHPVNQLAELLQAVDSGQADVTTLPDLVVVVANTWSSGASATLTEEAGRRREHYQQLADQYQELADRFAKGIVS
jgi:hypothetical protein